MRRLEDIIKISVEELCENLLKLKKSYFSPKGKPGESWEPLKESTLRIKRKKNIGTYNSFNKSTGQLQESLDIIPSYNKFTNKFTITLLSKAEYDDILVKYLTQTLGRDFISFGKLEKEYIFNNLKRLIISNAKKYN